MSTSPLTPPTSSPQHIPFDDVIGAIEYLPVLSAVATDILDSIEKENIDIAELAQKVARDQALSAKTLHFANSSFYATSKVTTIQQAIALVGVDAVRNLVLAAALSGCFSETTCAGFNFNAFWRHSIAAAVCAKVLARRLHLNQNLAFTAGLLHDIGRLVLVTRFTSAYEATLVYRAEHDCQLLDAERTMLGIDHQIAGHALATHWHFSEAIVHATVAHHDPDAMGAGSLAALINVADAIAHALDLSQAEDDLVPPVSLVAWHGVGLDSEAYMQIFRETELEFNQMATIL